MSTRAGTWARLALGFVALAFCAAPVPGDVGGCSQRAEELDPGTFFATKHSIDCDKCQECRITTDACDRACAGPSSQDRFPVGCVPLVHDGEVCLRALLHASCGEYQGHMRDGAPTAPTECAFCPMARP